MFNLHLFQFGQPAPVRNFLNYIAPNAATVKHVTRVDNFSRGSETGQVLGKHAFFIVIQEPNSVFQFCVVGLDAYSGYSGSGSHDFSLLMNFFHQHEVPMSLYSPNSYDELLELFGSRKDENGLQEMDADGIHRKHGPSVFDFDYSPGGMFDTVSSETASWIFGDQKPLEERTKAIQEFLWEQGPLGFARFLK